RNVRAHMHPGYESPDAVGPSGPVDPGLSVIALQSPDGRPLALLANYSQHYYGSPLLSSDYYGRFRNHLTKLVGDDVRRLTSPTPQSEIGQSLLPPPQSPGATTTSAPTNAFVAIMSQGT